MSLLVTAAAAKGLREGDSLLPTMPNIGDLAFGVDIVRSCGACAIDPGKATAPIWQFTYNGGSVYPDEPDALYRIPDGIHIAPTSSCSYDDEETHVTLTDSLDSTQEFMANLTVSVDPASSVQMEMAFSANMYASRELWFNGSATYAVYAARCLSFIANVDTFLPPSFSPSFIAAVAALDFTAPQALYNLISAFGTHFARSSTFGALAAITVELSDSSIGMIDAQTIEGGMFVAFLENIGFNISLLANLTDYHTLMQSSTSTRRGQFYLPAHRPPVPPGGDPYNALDWAAQVHVGSQPAPAVVHRHLIPIFELLTRGNFPNDPDIEAKQLALQEYITYVYCSEVPGCSYVTGLEGLMTYFESQQGCPDGFEQLAAAQGRAIIAVNHPSLAGVKHISQQLTDLEDPSHDHGATITMNFGASVDLYKAPCSNQAINSSDGCEHLLSYVSGKATGTAQLLQGPSGLPLLHLVPCVVKPYLQTPIVAQINVPVRTVAYFDHTVRSCPVGWHPLPRELANRTLVPNILPAVYPLPSDASLRIAEGLVHKHNVTMTMAMTNTVSIWLGSGASGWQGVSSQTYQTGVNSTHADLNIPYVTMLTCVKEFDKVTPSTTVNPPGITLFSNINNDANGGCAPGWASPQWPADTFGRVIVGATDPLHALQVYGSDKTITPGQTYYENEHSHTWTTTNAPVGSQTYYKAGSPNTAVVKEYPGGIPVQVNFVNNTVEGLPFVQLRICVPTV